MDLIGFPFARLINAARPAVLPKSMLSLFRYSSERLLPWLNTQRTLVAVRLEFLLEPAEAPDHQACRRVIGVIQPDLLDPVRGGRERAYRHEQGGNEKADIHGYDARRLALPAIRIGRHGCSWKRGWPRHKMIFPERTAHELACRCVLRSERRPPESLPNLHMCKQTLLFVIYIEYIYYERPLRTAEIDRDKLHVISICFFITSLIFYTVLLSLPR